MTPAGVVIGGRPYEVRAVPGGWQLRRSDQAGPVYTVSQSDTGYQCDCADARFRHHDCKHVLALEGLEMDMSSRLPADSAAELPADVVGAALPAPAPFGPAPGLAQLAQSLVKAQQACRAVQKTKDNAYHHYKYASAEAVIEEGNRVLGSVGLALAPVSQSVDGHEKEGEHRFELTRKFLLIDQSGASLPISVVWPICPEKGRPLDKATAIAATLSLAYTLRDLLLMPRVDETDDLAGRDDRQYQPPRRQAPAPARANGRAPAPPAAKPAPTEEELRISQDERDRHLAMFAEYLQRPVNKEMAADLRDYVERELKPSKPRLTEAHYQELHEALRAIWNRFFPPTTQPNKPR